MKQFDDPEDGPGAGYEQGLAAIIIVIGIAILLIVAVTIGVGIVWGFEFALKGVSVAVGLLVLLFRPNVLEDMVESIRSWSVWPFVRIPLLITVALVVWILWGWGGILWMGIAIVFFIILLKSPPPPWPMWPF